MMKTITRVLDWLGRSAAEAERRDREQFLSRSTDHFDLEIRMKELERAEIAGMRGW